MEKLQTLHDKYSNISEALGGFNYVPEFISGNLAHDLRPYQMEAIGRYEFYIDKDQNNRQLPIQLLFNMATGSGKTLIMAGLMLDLFRRGYRDFIFFVNSGNIIEKTRANFLDRNSIKYLFNEQIIIDGKQVNVQEVSNFSEARDDSINIVFTTIQGLHSDLNNPRENRLTYDEILERNVVLISDEAHHINASTKSKKELEVDRTWERTVGNILNGNVGNVLLEFTATIDLNDASIWQKYNQHIIYQYDLKAFRRDGFSKDVLIYSVDDNLIDRSLQAAIISQFRKKVALKNGIWLKPVVMLKSATIKESEQNFDNFLRMMADLSTDDILRQTRKLSEGSILFAAFEFFKTEGVSHNDLISELKTDFSAERVMLVDSNNIAANAQVTLNSLESRSNETRAIFAVDMLDEGWDVLNLFDIVRLYDTRDSRDGKVGKTTMREAQLIGRGARYFPFNFVDGDDRFTRKFDSNENQPLRVIEQLHYHSSHNPRYIQEIQQALKETGIVADNFVERELKLKEEFKKTPTYLSGVIWRNRRLTKDETLQFRQSKLIAADEYNIPELITLTLPSGIGQEISVFDGARSSDSVVDVQSTKVIKMSKDIPVHIIRSAINRNPHLTFDWLERSFPYISSWEAFMTDKKLLGAVQIEVTGSRDDIQGLNQDQKLYIAQEVLKAVEEKVETDTQEFAGSEEFEAVPIREHFTDVKRKFALNDSLDKEVGSPQYLSSKYALNVGNLDWYAYDENYGTSEEKSLVKTLDGIIEELEKKWTDIYLLRNEKYVTIYDFETGQAFEPDYLLLANDKKKGNISWQIFIEPKGNQFTKDGTFNDGKERWKQDFLLQIAKRFNAVTIADNSKYRVVGMPFYNEDHTRGEVISQLEALNS